MHIREFDFDRDYAAVLSLWENAGPGVRVSTSDAPEELAKKLRRDPDLFLVAEAEGAVVGTVLGGFDGRRGMVYHLAVAPERRRRGLGSALLAELEARLKAKGCRKYYLLVSDNDDGLVAFYEERGWSVMPVQALGKEIK